MRTFSVVDAFSWAFKTVFSNFWLFFSVGLLYFLVPSLDIPIVKFERRFEREEEKATQNVKIQTVNLEKRFERRAEDATQDVMKDGSLQPSSWSVSWFKPRSLKFGWWPTVLDWSLAACAVISFLLEFVSLWLFLGLLRIAFDFYDHGESKFKRMFSQGELLFRGWLLSIVYKLFIILGFVALIIPGIYLMCRYAFAFPAYVDKKTFIKESFSYSTVLSNGNKWKILGFLICVALVSIIPFIGITIGLLALVHVYRSLQETGSDSHVVREIVYEEGVMQS